MFTFDNWHQKSFPLRVAAWLEEVTLAEYRTYVRRRAAAGYPVLLIKMTVRGQRRRRVAESSLSSSAQRKLQFLRAHPQAQAWYNAEWQQAAWRKVQQSFLHAGLPREMIPVWYRLSATDTLLNNQPMKERLIDALRKTGLTKTAADAALTALLTEIKTVVFEEGGKIQILGFGTFYRKHRAARNGRNLQDGSPLAIPAKEELAFRPAPGLKRQAEV